MRLLDPKNPFFVYAEVFRMPTADGYFGLESTKNRTPSRVLEAEELEEVLETLTIQAP